MINDCINIKDIIITVNKDIVNTYHLVKNIRCLSKSDKCMIILSLIETYLMNEIKCLKRNKRHYIYEIEKKLSLQTINSVFNYNYYIMYASTEQNQLVLDIADIYRSLVDFFSKYKMNQPQNTVIICKQLTTKLLNLYDNSRDDIFNYTLFKDQINMLSYKIIKILDLQQDGFDCIRETIVDRFF